MSASDKITALARQVAIDQIAQDIAVNQKIGGLELLSTTEKGSLVGAINEVAKNSGADLSDYYTKPEIDSTFLKTSGGTVNGSLSVVNNDIGSSHTHSLSGKRVGFGVGYGGQNRGIYDYGTSRWIVHANQGGDIELGTQGTAYNRLIAGATGSLTWQGKNVVRSVGGASAGADGNVNITESNVAYPNYIIESAPASMQAKMDYLRANRLAFLPPEQIIVESTTDGGQTWVDANISDNVKRAVFAGTRNGWIPIPLLDDKKNKLCGTRITITARRYNVPTGTPETEKYQYWNQSYANGDERYFLLEHLYLWVNSLHDKIRFEVQKAYYTTPNTWVTIFNDQKCLLTGWEAGNYVKIPGTLLGGNWSNNLRLIFWTDGNDNGELTDDQYSSYGQTVSQIAGYGPGCWQWSNALMQIDHLYSWDAYQNVTFPAKLSATGLYGKADNAISEIKGGVDSLAGGKLSLHGKTATLAGGFQLDANNGTTKVALVGKPDGSLKWGTESVSESTNIAAGVYDAVTAFMTAHSIT